MYVILCVTKALLEPYESQVRNIDFMQDKHFKDKFLSGPFITNFHDNIIIRGSYKFLAVGKVPRSQGAKVPRCQSAKISQH